MESRAEEQQHALGRALRRRARAVKGRCLQELGAARGLHALEADDGLLQGADRLQKTCPEADQSVLFSKMYFHNM